MSEQLKTFQYYYYCCIWYDTSVEKQKETYKAVLNIHKLNSNYNKNI